MKRPTERSQTEHYSPEISEDSAPARIDRRSVLVGSAGLAVGGVLASTAARADGDGTTQLAQSRAATPGGGAGNRLYSANPTHSDMADISQNPANVPPAITRREPATVRLEFETIEIEAHLDANSTYRFWTFNGKIPGPFARVRVGDTVEVYLKNHEDNWYAHNIDLHAVTGPGGGAALAQPGPGEDYSFKFKALNAGLYVYHCAVSPVAQHISNGMYGLILVEPEEGLPPVDREYYVMQGELYTEERFGTSGLLNESYDKLVDERPEFFIFNGHTGALTEHYPLKANVGETVRIFFGVGGPNYISSFHVIGEIFDRVHLQGSLETPPLRDVQTVTVPAGGSAMVEFKCEVPGRFVLVDHALSRAEKGLAGYLFVEGDEAPDVFSSLDG
ncbi:copper-containing nitrite reductase [Pseudaestuariivita atlantica]|jgi:nitrite reductase (NO-forming)|uniref:copper-containing nitrite reductase n=1 Tax=Pseudaestuariivita atlantica TaxID=1317121 RepID=UPI0009E277CB|nr:copper-containing nitrite reductase [Pseudaestuariivita atlantica]MDP7151562.1 copper-containing nitrite reductase [Paracoccaceae bacterium]MDP7187162.1 copper-containing nitrite reductase [Paracoccaceae bacterium]